MKDGMFGLIIHAYLITCGRFAFFKGEILLLIIMFLKSSVRISFVVHTDKKKKKSFEVLWIAFLLLMNDKLELF